MIQCFNPKVKHGGGDFSCLGAVWPPLELEKVSIVTHRDE